MSDDRTPPHDTAAERAVLGAMMLSKEAIADVVEILRGPEFYSPHHETIYLTMVDLFTSGEPVDVVSVVDALRRAGALSRVGGPLAVHSLVEDVYVTANAAYHAGIVRDTGVRRRLAEAGSRLMQWGYSGEDDVDMLVDRAQAEVMDLVPGRTADYLPLADLVAETVDEIDASGATGEVTGVPFGFIDLDELTGGLQAGQFVVIAARPGMGKSTLAVDICRAASIRDRQTSVIFSLEMQRREITTRIIAAEAKVPLGNLRNAPTLSEPHWAEIAKALPRIEAAPLFIDDTANITMTEIRAKARRLKRDHDLRLIVIDYIQLMSSGRKVESRQLEVSEFSRQIKLLAKELEVPVVALSQLNRGVEQRSSKRPVMSDLRESGSLEQDADIVILIHREDMYEAESTRPGEADIIVAKHRNGATRDVVLAAQLHYSRFADLWQQK